MRCISRCRPTHNRQQPHSAHCAQRRIHTRTHTHSLTLARAHTQSLSLSLSLSLTHTHVPCVVFRYVAAATIGNNHVQPTAPIAARRCPTRPKMHCGTRHMHVTATHCNALQHTGRYCNTLQRTATHRTVLQHTATRRNVLQHSHTCSGTACSDSPVGT